MESIGSVFARMGAGCRRVARSLFGDVSWQRPGWWVRSSSAAQHRGTLALATVRANPRIASAVLAGIAIAIMGSWYAWHWYQSRPKPVEIGFTVMPPPVTCYACDPPRPPNPLLVQFAGSVAPLDRVGNKFISKTGDPRQGGVSMSPTLEGEWTWDDDKTLRFQPAADWPVGQKLDIDFAKRGFVADQVRLTEYEFEFTTPSFDAKIAGTEFHQDPVIAGNKKVVATIAFTHPVDRDSFERRVRLQMFDKITDTSEKELAAPKHTIVYDQLKLNAYIHSEQLEVPPKAGRLQLTIDAGVHATRGGNETKAPLTSNVAVPGLNSLKIASLSLDIARDERNEPNQVLLLESSFSVLESEMPKKVRAWLLPLQHPDPRLQRNVTGPFRWSNATLRPEVLTDANRVELAQIPGEREHYELHSFRYLADRRQGRTHSRGAGVSARAQHSFARCAALVVWREDAFAVRPQRAGNAYRDRAVVTTAVTASGDTDEWQFRNAAVSKLVVRHRKHHRALRENRAPAIRGSADAAVPFDRPG
jgi:hypothetical protein